MRTGIYSYTRVSSRILVASRCLFVLIFYFSSLAATVQSYFRLYKPVSQLVPHIGRLEYDIYGEVGVPDTKVHEASAVIISIYHL